MIALNKDKTLDEIWVSSDIYKSLKLTEYKGYKIYTSVLMQKDYAIITKMYL